MPGQSPEAIAARLGLGGASLQPVSGGDISRAYRVDVPTGPKEGRYFMKYNPESPPAMFAAEAQSLKLLAGGGLPVPQVLEWGVDFILMNYLDRDPGDAYGAGAALAAMHQNTASSRFGFDFTTFCGTTELNNSWSDSWPEFFAHNRIGHLVRQIRAKMGGMVRAADYDLLEEFVGALPGILPQCQASLVHGDLWGGNLYGATFIDPAAYYGHREVDLAMTRLFGGFSPSFYDGYNSIWAADKDAAHRVEIYNSYHLLNHYYLFESRGYLDSALAVARRHRSL